MATTTNITWTASNNSSFLAGERRAKSHLAAVRAARKYLAYELYGEGTITYHEDGCPIRIDEKSIFTGFRWQTRAPW